MGSMLIINRPTIPVDTLCSPESSIGCIADFLREAAARITPSLVEALRKLREYKWNGQTSGFWLSIP